MFRFIKGTNKRKTKTKIKIKGTRRIKKNHRFYEDSKEKKNVKKQTIRSVYKLR